PNSVISIGERSFSGCTGLTSIGIGNSVTTIGNNAFNSCNALSSVEIPNSVISIGERSFSGCTGLTSIGIGNSVTTIGNEAFKGCSGVKTFIIPKSVTSVGNDAFAKCYTLVKSAYPETLKNPFNFGLCFSYPVNSTIEDGVIYDTNKEKIYFVTSDIEGDFNIPESVKEIGPSAFQDCNRLTSVTLPDHINNIEDLAFKNCSGLTSIQIPDSLTHIAKSVFENCTGLTSVKLGESITLIDESAFNRCTTLASVENCDNLQTIGSYAFLNCPSLASLDNCVNLQTIGRFAFSNCSNLVSLGNCDNLQTIGMYAFQNCTNLVSFGNGENLKVIDGGAFENCKALGSSLTLSKCSIKSDAFKGCSSLKDISLKSCELWDRVFSGCTELNTINLSGDMYFWGDLIFMRGIEVWKDCPNIKDVYYTSGKPMEMNSNSFDDTVYKQATLYLRESSREEALKLTPWKLFENIENIPSFVYEYAGQTLLYEIIDENTCLVAKQHHLNGDLSIPETAFYRGTGYKVVSISQYAFEGSGINSVILPESVLTIETGAFASCGNLESVAIPNSVSEIGDRAFESCRKLTKLTIGDNVRTFGESIWHSCPEITEIYYQSLNPVGGYDNMFENTVYEKAMLYLAEEVREEAQHLTPWCNFKHIYRLPGEEYLLTYEYEGEEARVVGFKPDYEVDVIIPASVTKDGVEYAVTSIDNTAFKDSELLMSVVIPETIRNIQAGAFANCPILTKVNYNAIEAICDDNAADNPVFANCPKLNDIEIGESVITLPQYIFKSTNIKSIVIPDNVTILSEGCFAECYQLEDITIGKGVKAMRADAFGLKNPSDNPVTLHFNAINLEEYSGKDGDFGYGTECLPLSNRNVDKIIFGNEVETLCAYAFCECMPNVIESHNPVPPILGIACFESTNKETCKLIIPEGSLTSYSMADIWMEFLNVDASLSGIEDVLTDENCIVKIYTLEGLKIYDGSACEMPALNGLYIIIRKGKAEKVYLRN
ncbi:MAG: leucine-rich repeat domain-containing protein, partial [Muribaculaceae bacterium]|nr:leucine-rich repeat domain-containing protein [Muribaculaceae bacterium]